MHDLEVQMHPILKEENKILSHLNTHLGMVSLNQTQFW